MTNTSLQCMGSLRVPFTFRVVWHDKRCCEFVLEREPLRIRKFAVSVFGLLPILFAFALPITNRASTAGIGLVILGIVYCCSRHLYVQRESLLVIASMGLQFTTTYADGRQMSRFIEKRLMIACAINEGISMQSVLYYLAVVLKNCDYKNADVGTSSPYPQNLQCIIPLFQATVPRLDCLRQMYTIVSEVLALNAVNSEANGPFPSAQWSSMSRREASRRKIANLNRNHLATNL